MTTKGIRIMSSPMGFWPDPWQAWTDYWIDACQRTVLFWDVMRRRGNTFIEHEEKGKPPVLSFASEMVLDGRTLSKPVNYFLMRIVPPTGVTVDPTKRPFVIVDPRAGHGPGIGGSKVDSTNDQRAPTSLDMQQGGPSMAGPAAPFLNGDMSIVTIGAIGLVALVVIKALRKKG